MEGDGQYEDVREGIEEGIGPSPIHSNELAQKNKEKKRRRNQPSPVLGFFSEFSPKSRRQDGDPRLILVQVQILASPEMPSQVKKDSPPRRSSSGSSPPTSRPLRAPVTRTTGRQRSEPPRRRRWRLPPPLKIYQVKNALESLVSSEADWVDQSSENL